VKRKPRNCYGCRALDECWFRGFLCKLRYPIDEVPTTRPGAGKIYVPTPTEACPKPRTRKQLSCCEPHKNKET
jgi:hypothetical protein